MGREDAPARGFSLIELIVVLTILSLMLGVVVPIYHGSLSRTRSAGATRDFLATMKYAQERAVTDATEHRLYLDDD